MSTFYYLHIMDWDDICDRQGKKGEGTKPDYILQALEDREKKEAEGFGLKEKETLEAFMENKPLLPRKCSCGKINNCLKDYCESCGNKLEESNLQRNKDILSQEEQEKQELKAQLKNVLNILDKTGLDLDVEDMI